MRILAVICLLSYLFVPVPSLIVRSARTNCVLWGVPVSEGSVFRISWMHSVSRRIVSEDYVIGSGGLLCLRSMTFDHEGPNLPSFPEEGLSWTFRDGKVIVSGYELRIDKLSLGIAGEFHQLQYGEDTLDLLAFVGTDRVFNVSTELIPALLLLTVRCGNSPIT